MASGFSIPNIVKRIFKWDSSWYFEIWNSDTNYGSKAQKLKIVLENPAALFLFLLLCDLISMGKYELFEKGKEEPADAIDEHDILEVLSKPNPMQTGKQFIWDYMFWRLIGTASLLSDSKVLKGKEENVMYWMAPDCIRWPKWFKDNAQTLFLSREAIRELNGKTLKYVTPNQEMPFKYEMMKQFFDISNGIKSWFEGPSRLDALYKVAKNSENSLDSKNINSHLARKFIVSGKHDPTNISTLPMGADEKGDIEKKVMGKKNVHAMKSMVDIKRFLEDVGALEKLDKAFWNDAFIFGKTLNIPKDVMEMLDKGATYENQEKARASIISYCIVPAAEDFCEGVLDFFDLEGYVLKLNFDHLPFVQTFEMDRAETDDKKASAFFKLVRAGASQEEAADAVGLDLTTFTEPRNMGGGLSGETEEGQESEEGKGKLKVLG